MAKSAPAKKNIASPRKDSPQETARAHPKSKSVAGSASATPKTTNGATSRQPRDSRSTTPKKRKKWTIMVYMAGDNNLSEDMVTALKQMTMLVGDDNIHLVALYDSNYPSVPVKIYEFTKPLPNSAGAERYIEEFLSDLTPSTRPGNPQTESYWIKTFVRRVSERFPADRYALILSGHSDGIIGKTLLRDENPNVVLDVKKLQKILYDARPRVNGKRRKFDLLGFDGCLMSMLEVSYELRDVARVMVASEGNIPTTGWDYSRLLTRLKNDPGMDETCFAEHIVRTYAQHNIDYAVSGRSVDISACNLRKVTDVESIVQAIARHLLRILSLVPFGNNDDQDERVRDDRFVREHFIDCLVLAHYRSQAFMHNQAVDLVDLIFNLILGSIKRLIELGQIHQRVDSANPTLFDRIHNETLDLIEMFLSLLGELYDGDKRFVIAACSVGAEYQFSKGTAVFFPWTTTALEMVYDRYADLDFNENNCWIKLLEKRLDLTIRTQFDDHFTKTQKVSTVAGIAGSGHLTSTFLQLFQITLANYSNLAHREHGGKEHGGKEHGGKGELEAFYRYFSQFRHFDPDFFGRGCLALEEKCPE